MDIWEDSAEFLGFFTRMLNGRCESFCIYKYARRADQSIGWKINFWSKYHLLSPYLIYKAFSLDSILTFTRFISCGNEALLGQLTHCLGLIKILTWLLKLGLRIIRRCPIFQLINYFSIRFVRLRNLGFGGKLLNGVWVLLNLRNVKCFCGHCIMHIRCNEKFWIMINHNIIIIHNNH